MRALWFVREDLTRQPGGDTTQILGTAVALRARGVVVELTSNPLAELAGYDVAHLFHLDRLWENAAIARRLRAAGVPAVLSTIYWPPDEYDRRGRTGLAGLVGRWCGSRVLENVRVAWRALPRALRRGARGGPPARGGWRSRPWGFQAAVQALLEAVEVLLPNSIAEQEQIERRFGVRKPGVIVPNAADVELFGPRPEEPAAPRDGVLCVGRIEPRKNQLALIRALRGTGVRLTLVGRAGPTSRAYAARCRRLGGPEVTFVPQQPPAALREFYRAARVHACVSWYETPGLASLEAALAGCALVVTPGGCTREYFGEQAHYCAPDDVEAIRAAVRSALARGPAPELAARVARDFTWAAAAEKTLEAYQRALSHPRSDRRPAPYAGGGHCKAL